jgi:hypothetical protein
LVHAHCPNTNINAQGVPRFIAISREVRNFKLHFDEICRFNDARFTVLCEEMKNCFKEVPPNVVECILKRFDVQGVKPITIEDIRASVMEILSGMPATSNGSSSYSIVDSLKNLIEQQKNMSDKVDRLGSGQGYIQPQIGSSSGASNSSQLVSIDGRPSHVRRVHYWTGVDNISQMVPFGFV